MMNKFFIAALFLPFLLRAQIEVSLPAVVEVTQKAEYSLYDLAILKEGTSDELENLKRVVVTDLTRRGILEAVRDADLKVKIIFEDSFKIVTSTQINRYELQRKIANHLTAECNTCIFDIQLSKLPFVNNPAMNFRTSDFELGKGNFMLPLLTHAADSIQPARFYAAGTWKTFKKVPVANKWLIQGYRVTAEDLKEELKDVTFMNDKIVSKQDILGRQLTRSVAANAFITRDVLVVEKLIKKSDVIRLFVKDGPFEIEMNAQAESDGLAGDSIKVKANQKMITAKVVSKDKVVSE